MSESTTRRPLPPFLHGCPREVKKITCVDCLIAEEDWEMSESQVRCVDCNYRFVVDRVCYMCHQSIKPCESVGFTFFDNNAFHLNCDFETDGMKHFFCKHCETWDVKEGYDKRYKACEDCVEGYYSDCPECGKRTAHDDMHVWKGAPVGPCDECFKKPRENGCIHCGNQDMTNSNTGTKACAKCCKGMYETCNSCEKSMLMCEMRHITAEGWNVWICGGCDIKCRGCEKAYVRMEGDDCLSCKSKSTLKVECKECKVRVPVDRYSEQMFMCVVCAGTKFPNCDECGQLFVKDDWKEDDLCSLCEFKGHGTRCQECQELTKESELEWHCDRYMCKKCTDMRARTCKKCFAEFYTLMGDPKMCVPCSYAERKRKAVDDQAKNAKKRKTGFFESSKF